MIKQILKFLLSSFLVAVIVTSITFLVLLILGKFQLVRLLNIYFLEGSIFVIISAILSLGNLGEKVYISYIYFRALNLLTNSDTAKNEMPLNSSLLPFFTGLFIYSIILLIHIIFKPTF